MLKEIYNHKWFPRMFYKTPDGGEDSGVTAYMLIEWKPLFSIGLLKFEEGTREAYHSHAFNAVTWWLSGFITELAHEGDHINIQFYKGPSTFMKRTPRGKMHKIDADRVSWALTLRGPWKNTWQEFRDGKMVTLTHGRKIVD